MVLADLWQELRNVRTQEIADLKKEVQKLKSQAQTKRNLNQAELKIKAQEVRGELLDFVVKLQEQAKESKAQREAERKQRHKKVSKRQEEVSDLLEEFAKRRQDYRVEIASNSRILTQELQDFHISLEKSIWGCVKSAKEVSEGEKVKPTSSDTFNDKKNNSAPLLKQVNQVYQMIEKANGISLLEIEQGLSIDRKITIELIRKLIKQEKIEQRDKLYYACH